MNPGRTLVLALLAAALLPAAEDSGWRPVTPIPRPAFGAERFAAIGQVAADPRLWQVAVHREAAPATCAANADGLDWSACFTEAGDPQLAELVCERALPAGASGVAWTVGLELDGCPPPTWHVRLGDRNGEVHQFTAGAWAEDGIMRLHAAFTGGQHWDGDGRLDPPLTLHSLVAERPRRCRQGGFRARLGTLHILGAEAVPTPPRPTVAVLAPPPGHLYRPGQVAELRARHPLHPVAWRLLDLQGRELASAPPSSAPSVRWTLERPGWYDWQFSCPAAGPLATVSYRCAVLPDAPILNPAVGVCSHLHRVAAGGGTYGRWPAEALDLVPRLGCGWIRDELPWHQVEERVGTFAIPENPRWIPPRPDWFLARAHELGLGVLLILEAGHRDFGQGWPLTGESRAAFAGYAGRLARHAHQATAFEIWNEWTVGTGVPRALRPAGGNTPEAYAALVAAVTPVLRAARPDATVVGIGGEHPFARAGWEGMLRAGVAPLVDACSFHPYRYYADAESTDLVGEVAAAAQAVRASGGGGRIWISEIGWTCPATGLGADERSQAFHTVRSLALLPCVAGVERTFLYSLIDNGTDPYEKEDHFGLVHHGSHDLMPKPAAVAVAAFNRFTSGATCRGLVRSGQAWAVAWRLMDGDDLVMAWSAGGGLPLATLPLAASPAAAWDAAGAPLDAPSLGPWPVYLRGRALLAAEPRIADGSPP